MANKFKIKQMEEKILHLIEILSKFAENDKSI